MLELATGGFMINRKIPITVDIRYKFVLTVDILVTVLWF